ncbi:MAG: TrmH family RNA methyltransferase [Patescibacteria group bacterium]|mgnify:CR=1 FL=1
MIKMDSKQLRKIRPEKWQVDNIKRNPIYLVLDNVIDTYNIGSLFRLGDAVSVEKIYICGESEYPPSSRIHKAAVGTETWVPWEKRDSVIEIVKELKQKNIQIITVEQNPRSISYSNLKPKFPCAIVVGNETAGVSKDVLKLADIIVELPMFGVNKSFNVWGSAAVVVYKILESVGETSS